MARLRRSKITQSEFFPGFADITEIGVGSLATVYRAREVGTNRQVALKLLNVRDASPRALESFERESMALGALSSHPNIVTLFRSFRAGDGRPVLVLELCAGAIGDRLQGGQGLPVPDVVSIGIKIAGALETAHRGGILHRDVKPQNILVTEFGEPALADFGVAMLQSSTQTTAGLFDFTTLHAAPELLEGGDTSAATDVYELASSLYQLVAGRSAFRAYDEESPAAVILRILRDPVQPLAHAQAPTALSDLFIRAMAKDKDNRPASAAEFASDLAAIEIAQNWPRTQFLVRESPTSAHGPWTASPPPPPVITREPWTAAAPAGRSFASLPADLPPQPPRVASPPADDPWSSTTLSRPAAPDAPAAPPAPPVARPVAPVVPVAPPRPPVVSAPAGPPPAVPYPVPPVVAPPPPAVPQAPQVPSTPVPDDDYRAWRPPALLPREDAQPVPEPQPEPPAEQTTRRSMLPPSAWSPPAPVAPPEPAAPEPAAPEPAAPEPVLPPDRTPLRIDEGLNPPPDATVVRSSLPRVPPAVPPPVPDQVAGSGPSPWVPQAEATVSRASLSDIAEPPAGGPEQTVFRSSLPRIPQAPPSDGNETVSRSSLGGAPQAYPIAPQGPQQHPGQAVPTWATRAQPPAATGTARSPLDLTLDPASLRKRVTIRAGAAALAIDEHRLVLRTYLRKTEVPWTEILGFEPRFDGVGAGGSGGHLVAITRSGPVELPATKRSVADLRYMQALLEAYLRRAHGTIPPR